MAFRRILSISENFVMHFDPSLPFGVVCHDAGGANQIAAMLQTYRWKPEWVIAEGPAAIIWQRHFPDTPRRSGLPRPTGEAAIITGTGWGSDLEHHAREAARMAGIRTIAVMDHWTHFRERFVRHGREVLPDEFWVVDEDAEKMARALFPGKMVILQPDCYGEREAALVEPVRDTTPSTLLYLLEPIRADWGRNEPGEFQALRFFLESLPALGLLPSTAIHLRPHPSEAPEKYLAFLRDSEAFPVHLASGSLSEALSRCRWVAGCQTYAMTLALRTGRKVFGSLPPWAPACVLPHQGIVHLRNLMPV